MNSLEFHLTLTVMLSYILSLLLLTDTTLVKYTESGDYGGQSTSNFKVKVRVNNVQIISDGNISIPVSMSYDKDLLKVSPLNFFEINSTFSLIIYYSYDVLDYYSYDVSEVKYIDGVARKKEFIFNTTSLIELNKSMIYCEYPLERQYNFLQGEYNFGFIKTHMKPDFLLSEQLKVRITNIHTNSTEEKQLVYDDNLEILKYEMPVLINNQIYKVDYLFENNKELYRSNYFKTSLFNTFSEKISTNFEGEHLPILWEIEPCVLYYQINRIMAEQGEVLDFYEQILPSPVVRNFEYDNYDYPKLLTVEIDTTKTDMNKYGYKTAQQLGFSVNRTTSYIGFVPTRDFFYLLNLNNDRSTTSYNLLLTDEEINDKLILRRKTPGFLIKSFISKTITDDVRGFKNQAANSNLAYHLIAPIANINRCYFDYQDKYYYTMKYIIPGIDKVCFTGEYEIGPAR